MNKRKERNSILNLLIIASFVVTLFSPMQNVQAAEIENTVFINEIESNDEVTDDWIEIINTGNSDVDISGWFVVDDKGLKNVDENTEWRIAEGTVLKPDQMLVIEQGDGMGLGKNDAVYLYDRSGKTVIDSHVYTAHAAGTWSRVPDGTGEFIDQEPTKGALNIVEKEESEVKNPVFINEIESDDKVTDIDWIEIINTGNSDVDISGWFVTDDKGLERLKNNEEWRIADGTVLKAGEILVIEQDVVLDNLSLGKDDAVNLYDRNETLLDSHTYSGHADGTYSRVPDGKGEFVDQEPTKGAVNIVEKEESPKHELKINEINSSPDDWVELINLGTEEMDLSGYEIRDNSDDHRWKFAEGTKLGAGELVVVDAKTPGQVYNDKTNAYEDGTFEAAIGIGSGDSIRLYDSEGNLLDEHSWNGHPSFEGNESIASYGRYPDGTGSFVLTKETKGLPNEWYPPQIVINEVESNGDETDWAEIYNIGTTAVDISGWYLFDNDPVGHKGENTPVADGTVLHPGGFYVFEENKDFSFGLGKEDQVSIFNKDGVLVAEYAWNGHANGVYARIPDGTGEFQDFSPSTKGKANIVTNPVRINEVQSKDPNDGPDWIELANPTGEVLDISGIVIKDNDDEHEYVIPEGTTIPANGFLVLTEETFGFGLGKNDSVRLFENDRLIDSTTWADHTNPTWGLYPDVNGNEYRNTKEETPGAPNKFADIPETIAWPGNGEVVVFDNEPTFLEDSSGLDFFNGQLYAVDNGTAKFWILDVAKDGSLSFA